MSHLLQLAEKEQKSVILVDVRTPKEFREDGMPLAINIPSSDFNVSQFEPYRDYNICLLCHSGNRAKKIQQKLLDHGFTNVALSFRHMSHVDKSAPETGWSIDRQFRLILGLVLAIFFIAYFVGGELWLVLPGILCTGLLFSVITDQCYLKMGIARLPWNKK